MGCLVQVELDINKSVLKYCANISRVSNHLLLCFDFTSLTFLSCVLIVKLYWQQEEFYVKNVLQ